VSGGIGLHKRNSEAGWGRVLSFLLYLRVSENNDPVLLVDGPLNG
jgi:hypothetical protein